MKTISGAMGGFIISTIIALRVNEVLPVGIIIFGSMVAMIVELIPHKKLNDNFTIPIASAFPYN